MVKGGADNRSFRLQRRKKRPKKFHGRRTVGQPVYGEADEIGEFPGASEHSVVSETPEIGALMILLMTLLFWKTLLLLIIQRLQLHKEKLTLFYLGHPPTNCQAIV